MKRMTALRLGAGLTRAKLGAKAEVHPARVGQIENGRVLPYPVELERLSVVLGWTEDPAGLLAEVRE